MCLNGCLKFVDNNGICFWMVCWLFCDIRNQLLDELVIIIS